MKRIITQLLPIICLILFGQLKAQAPPEILHYNFNGTGTLIPNMASSPPLGTTNASIVGTQSLGSTGQCAGALVGDGSTTSYVNTAWTTSLSGSWTISFWTASITPSSTLWYIFGDLNASSFRCFTNGVAGANNWILRGPINDILLTGGATMAPQLNTFVYNSTTSVTTAYLNGVFNASVTQNPVTITGTGPFKVGQYGSNSGLPSGGLMDEFRVYSRALTVTEIQQLANLVPTSTVITVTSCGSYTSLGNNVYTVSGVYTETVNLCGGSATNTINLTVNPAPTMTVTASNSLICNGQSTDLITTGTATSFSWSTGSTNYSTSVAPATNTSYVVTGSIAACSITKTISINVNPTPIVNLVVFSNSVCLGNSISFTASGAPSYSWSPVASSNATLIDSPTMTTTYSVTGTNSYNCSDTKSVTITVYSFTPGISNPVSTCLGNPVNLTATGGTSYTWSTNAPFASISVTPVTTTAYSVVSTGSNSCLGNNSTTVTVNSNPTVTALAQRTVMCKGETNTLTAAGASNYSWSNNATGSVVVITPTANVTTNYIVSGSNTAGCSHTAQVSVKVNLCSGIQEGNTSELGLSLYPNPSKGLFELKAETNQIGKTIRIFNILGTAILEEKINSTSAYFDIQTQPKGIYFVYMIDSEKVVFVSKLIIE